MSEDPYSGAESLFKRGQDAAVGTVATKTTAIAGAIGTKALLGGFALAKGAVTLVGKGALLALKTIILKMGLTVVIATGGIALLGVFVGLMIVGGAAGASGREPEFRQVSIQTWKTAKDLAPADTKWVSGVSLERFTVPWGLLEAIDIFDGQAALDARTIAKLLAPVASYRSTSITRVTVTPATAKTAAQTVVTIIPIHLLERVSAWTGDYTHVYTKKTSDNGSTFYTLTRVDFVSSWDRLDRALAERLDRTVGSDERDILVSMGINATYGEPDDIVALQFYGAPAMTPVIVGDFAFPVAGSWRVTSPFGAFRGAQGRHRGLDLGARTGTPLVAVTDGRVSTLNSPRGGLVLFIHADNGMRFLYAHLSSFAVRDGTHVKRGDLVGFVGNTGFSTGPHLHIEFIMPDGTRVDPAPYLIH
ncbi:MAG: Glycyl-glycine endopeptidase ALE-1 [Syntrophomonadaceae bacterium]|nr:Glycyl-glycine endopeptidase ALE-1 [Bacillota bacterium]